MNILSGPAWQELMKYEAADLVKNQFNQRHQRELNSSKAREISTSFAQARSYFSASATADRSVRPLLTYYGVLSMTRGLILFLSPTIREAGLSQAHGLSANSWQDELSNERGCISELKLTINKAGTLRQLIEHTQHQSLLSKRGSYSCSVPPAGCSFSLGELLERIPEIRNTLVDWRPNNEIVEIFPHRGPPRMNGMAVLCALSSVTMDDIRNVFGPECQSFNLGNPGFRTFLTPETDRVSWSDGPTSRWIPELVSPHGPFSQISRFAMKKMSFGGELSKLVSAFALSFSIGMLSRYYPSHWMSILNNQRHNASLPTLVTALEHTEEAVPRMVVEFLEFRPR